MVGSPICACQLATGNQRRVYLRDVLEFAKKRDKQRLAALDLLASDALEAGLYDRNVFPEGGTDE